MDPWNSSHATSLQSCDHDPGAWHPACNYDEAMSHDHVIVISNVSCWLPTSKFNGEASRKSDVASTPAAFLLSSACLWYPLHSTCPLANL